ncbi:MAG: PIN domain-containing protein, partial [Candidatus Micrarchaeia archaeon]
MDQKSVILDANAVLTPYQFKLDIFRELGDLLEPPYKLLVPTCVVSEVKRLAKGRGKEAMAARFALKLIEVNCESGKLSKIKGSGPADDWIVDFSSKNKAIVF